MQTSIFTITCRGEGGGVALMESLQHIWTTCCCQCSPPPPLASDSERIPVLDRHYMYHFNSQEKLKTMLMQNFGVTNKEHYGMLWYFLEWSIAYPV